MIKFEYNQLWRQRNGGVARIVIAAGILVYASNEFFYASNREGGNLVMNRPHGCDLMTLIK